MLPQCPIMLLIYTRLISPLKLKCGFRWLLWLWRHLVLLDIWYMFTNNSTCVGRYKCLPVFKVQNCIVNYVMKLFFEAWWLELKWPRNGEGLVQELIVRSCSAYILEKIRCLKSILFINMKTISNTTTTIFNPWSLHFSCFCSRTPTDVCKISMVYPW